MARKKNWMADAFPPERRGKLHRDLGVPEDRPIPVAKLQAAAKRAERTEDTRLQREVTLARTGARIAKGK